MAAIDNSRRIFLNSYWPWPAEGYRIINLDPVLEAYPVPDTEEQRTALISLMRHPNITMYRKEDLPNRFHWKNHRRIAPIIGIQDEGWSLVSTPTRTVSGGTHGYDNALESMSPVFVVSGQSFREGSFVRGAEHVDVYPLVCHLLGIEPAPNNGSLTRVEGFLKTNLVQ
jgi:predicted AlkP superfamily pyrophosphatase or phosphodiesterase